MTWLDVPAPWAMRLQDAASPNQEGIHELYDHIMFYLALVLGLVSYMTIVIVKDFTKNKFAHKQLRHGQTLEIIWTMFPALILLLMSFPSFILLYLSDEVLTPALTVKIVGLQWYWKYEYSDFVNKTGETLEYESYIMPDDMLEEGNTRLLDTDTSIVLPVDTHVRFIVTANDVMHSFAVPSLGIKIDATPGRLNQVSTLMERTGVFYGQCSELCGVNHALMPMKMQCVTMEDFLTYLSELSE
ncbi:cytochrome c oxidase subunit 2 (mitochondrion) [Australozyma saopauloensis]|uniref:Cytochrome c oxidase subunit 2 n=1 Tax=Australozyma saopauloensis TaxID=291208 RepID=A0AAX4HGZ4_9ASCO|nr:cytochrome c oxidase subunit 2 [[Candida] saopauloensis]